MFSKMSDRRRVKSQAALCRFRQQNHSFEGVAPSRRKAQPGLMRLMHRGGNYALNCVYVLIVLVGQSVCLSAFAHRDGGKIVLISTRRLSLPLSVVLFVELFLFNAFVFARCKSVALFQSLSVCCLLFVLGTWPTSRHMVDIFSPELVTVGLVVAVHAAWGAIVYMCLAAVEDGQ